MAKNRGVFEMWLSKQFPDRLLTYQFSVENGYDNETVNAMWIGFNAGIELFQ